MTTIDIENMSAADLKAKRAELVEAIKGSPDLAVRYVQARLDAKTRDEKLAEQGATITALQQGLAAATEKTAALDAELAKAKQETADADARATEMLGAANRIRDEADRMNKDHAKASAEAKAAADKAIADLKAELAKATELAKARRAALADVMSHANALAAKVAPLLAAE